MGLTRSVDTTYSNPGNTSIESGEEQRFDYSWGGTWERTGSFWSWNSSLYDKCTKFSVYKYYENPADDGSTTGPDMRPAGMNRNCPEGSVCTVVRSRGYNASCSAVNAGINPRVVERELILDY